MLAYAFLGNRASFHEPRPRPSWAMNERLNVQVFGLFQTERQKARKELNADVWPDPRPVCLWVRWNLGFGIGLFEVKLLATTLFEVIMKWLVFGDSCGRIKASNEEKKEKARTRKKAWTSRSCEGLRRAMRKNKPNCAPE